MSEPVFDLVAVAYEAPMETQAFLRSLHHVEVPFTFTVIDNNTPSGMTQKIIESEIEAVQGLDRCLEATMLLNPENLGYAKACNVGAEHGNAPYIGLLNCDVQMRPGVLARLATEMDAQQDIGVIGPRTKGSNGKLTHAGIVPGPKGFQHRYWQKPDSGQGLEQMDVPTVSGATYFVRRSMWEELTNCDEYREVAPHARGAFLPTQHYFEETFCSLHAKAHDWRVVYEGSATMIHEWNRSLGSGAARYWNESREYFLKACAAHGIEDTGT